MDLLFQVINSISMSPPISKLCMLLRVGHTHQGHQLISGLTQIFVHSFTPTSNLESTVNQT